MGDHAPDRRRYSPEATRGLGRAGGRRRGEVVPALGLWQAEEAAGFLQNVAQLGQVFAGGDQVQEVAVLPLGGIGPMPGSALARLGPAQANIEAATRRVLDVADQPVTTFAAAIGKVVSAHRLGVTCEAAGQFGCGVRHCGLRKEEGPPLRPPGKEAT